MKYRKQVSIAVCAVVAAYSAYYLSQDSNRFRAQRQASSLARAPAQKGPSFKSGSLLSAASESENAKFARAANERTQNRKSSELFDESKEEGRLLNAHLLLANAIGEDSEKNFQASLDELVKHGDQVVPMLAEAYAGLPEGAYLARTDIVLTLAHLGHPKTFPYLAEILGQEMPPERSQEAEYSTRQSESMIRGAALEGIAAFAALGDAGALQVVKGALRHSEISVRSQAMSIVAGLEKDPKKVSRILRENLSPSDYAWWVQTQTNPTQVGFVSNE